MLSFIEYLNMPTKVALAIVAVILIIQIIGEILEFKGKVVPEFIKIRKFFQRKKQEKKEKDELMKRVDTLLQHYSSDNIALRDKWMQWVNDRAVVYDKSIDKLEDFGASLADVAQALRDNTKMTEEIFVQSSRDRIIDFATKVSNENIPVSREEFNRIFKVYTKYEKFLEEHNMTNGEIDINYGIIQEAYEQHMKNHTFVEDMRGYNR